MKTLIKIDIIQLLKNLFNSSNKNKLYYRKGRFFHIFIEAYPLVYQQDDKIILDSNLLCEIIKKMNITSKFRFKKSKVKRYKFIKKKVFNYERKLLF
jgi:hypothetical protein